jgi:hypothetical protein
MRADSSKMILLSYAVPQKTVLVRTRSALGDLRQGTQGSAKAGARLLNGVLRPSILLRQHDRDDPPGHRGIGWVG